MHPGPNGRGRTSRTSSVSGRESLVHRPEEATRCRACVRARPAPRAQSQVRVGCRGQETELRIATRPSPSLRGRARGTDRQLENRAPGRVGRRRRVQLHPYLKRAIATVAASPHSSEVGALAGAMHRGAWPSRVSRERGRREDPRAREGRRWGAREGATDRDPTTDKPGTVGGRPGLYCRGATPRS